MIAVAFSPRCRNSSGRVVFDDEIDELAGRHLLEIKARLPVTLFLAGDRALHAASCAAWAEAAAAGTGLRLGTGREQVDAEEVVSGVLGLS